MSNDGVLVSKRWLERANVKLFGNKEIDEEGKATGGVFYDVRPARLQSAWAQSNGVWTATACFVVNDAIDTSFTFPVYAPTATEDPGGTAETTRFFVVWRGRWELVAGAGGGGTPTYTSASMLGVNGVNYIYIPNTTAGNTVKIVTGVTASNNVLTFSTINGTYAASTAKTVVKDIT